MRLAYFSNCDPPQRANLGRVDLHSSRVVLRHASAASAICQCHELIMMIDAVRLCAAAALSVLPRRPDQPASQPASTPFAVQWFSYLSNPILHNTTSHRPGVASARSRSRSSNSNSSRPARQRRGHCAARLGYKSHLSLDKLRRGCKWSPRQTVFILLFFEPPREPWREPRPLGSRHSGRH